MHARWESSKTPSLQTIQLYWYVRVIVEFHHCSIIDGPHDGKLKYSDFLYHFYFKFPRAINVQVNQNLTKAAGLWCKSLAAWQGFQSITVLVTNSEHNTLNAIVSVPALSIILLSDWVFELAKTAPVCVRVWCGTVLSPSATLCNTQLHLDCKKFKKVCSSFSVISPLPFRPVSTIIYLR